MPERPIVRTDMDVPVLDVQSETDIVVLRTHLNRQDDHPNFRLWELAGSATSASTAVPSPGLRTRPRPVTRAPSASTPHPPSRWPRRHGSAGSVGHGGCCPPSAPRITLGDPSAADPVARDQYGNALGGIRYPHLDVPIARIDGVRNTAPTSDPIQGSSVRCPVGRSRSPTRSSPSCTRRQADYVAQFGAAADQAVDGGFLLPEDADVLKPPPRHRRRSASAPPGGGPEGGWCPAMSRPPPLRDERPPTSGAAAPARSPCVGADRVGHGARTIRTPRRSHGRRVTWRC